MARPKVYDDALRAALISAAADQLAEGGVGHLSLRSVAQAAGTSTNAIYSIFGGKPDLVEAVVADALASFTAAQRATPQHQTAQTQTSQSQTAQADLEADLAELGRAYRRWALERPTLYAVIFGDRVAAPEGSHDSEDDGFQPLLGLVTKLIEAGIFRDEQPRLVALSIWAGVHGLVSLEHVALGDQPAKVRDAAYDAHLAALFRGWRR